MAIIARRDASIYLHKTKHVAMIVCSFCDSRNIITDPCCCQCGAPFGKITESEIKKELITNESDNIDDLLEFFKDTLPSWSYNKRGKNEQ